MYIDAHCHFWDPARGDYGWLLNGPSHLAPLRRIFGPQDLAQLDGGIPVVAVQAADSLAETQYLLDLAQHNPRIAAVVGWVDLTQDHAAREIAQLARNPVLKGLRPMLQDIEDSDWILHAPRADAIAAMMQLGLRLDALVQTRHLAPLDQLALRWPDLPIVIDHCAKPAMGGALEAGWSVGMARLAAHPQVMCKLSGLLTEVPHQCDDPFGAVQSVFETVLDMFGPDRVMWGSDWPVLTLAASYQDWQNMTQRLLAGHSAAVRAAIMGQTAARFYGVGAAHG